MTKKLRNTIALIRHGKIDKLLDAAAWNVPRWFFYYNHSKLLMSDNPVWNSQYFPDYTYRFVKQDDIQVLARDGFTDEKIVSRLEASDRGILMEKDGEVMSIIWGGRGKKFLQLSGAIFETSDDGFFLYGGYTNEKERLKGLFYSVTKYIYDIYSREGHGRVWCAVNATSGEWLEKWVTKMNFRAMGETYYFRFLFFNVCYYKFWPYPTSKIHLFFRNPPGNLKCV